MHVALMATRICFIEKLQHLLVANCNPRSMRIDPGQEAILWFVECCPLWYAP